MAESWRLSEAIMSASRELTEPPPGANVTDDLAKIDELTDQAKPTQARSWAEVRAKLRVSGGSAWDEIADPQAFIREA